MEEKEAQMAYEKMMSDSADKRARDTKAAVEKAEQKAELEDLLQEQKGEMKEMAAELMAVEKILSQLQIECGWFLDNFDARKAARSDEMNSLDRAKAVLNGADYSLIQVRTHSHLRKTIV